MLLRRFNTFKRRPPIQFLLCDVASGSTQKESKNGKTNFRFQERQKMRGVDTAEGVIEIENVENEGSMKINKKFIL